MSETSLRFETPENVEVRYQAAGLGTRFVAWVVDQIAVWLIMIVLMIGLLALGLSYTAILDEAYGDDEESSRRAVMYFVGLMSLVWGLGSFVYFGALELFMKGQTIGKRASKIRVVKANGFQLDAASIVVRNIFRAIDHLPPLWIVPLVSKRSQRTGDMAAGTLVVFDTVPVLSAVREELAGRKAAEAKFRFDHAQLGRLAATDFTTVERVLDRLPALPPSQQAELVATCVTRIAAKVRMTTPSPEEAVEFLQDLLAAEFRRQDRKLV